MTAMQATIDHIVINVSDAEKMLDFYTRVIGLEPARVDQWRAGEVPFPSLRLCTDSLIDLFPPQMWNPKGQGDERSQAPNYDHFCLTLVREDWDAVRDRLTAEGTRIEVAPTTRWGAHGNGTSVYIRDPEGNRVELRYYE